MISYDKKISKLFIYWLTLSLFLVFAILIVGGLTRLTNSGLSITEWELFSGILPPLTQSSWQEYFNEYKKIPQYQLINSSMNISEFKIIFYWEYAHRILARLIGIFFLVPLIFFYFTKKIERRILLPNLLVGFLILLQGLVGWYMVKSGLVNDVTVSHYRLSLHLLIAISIISIIFWQILIFKGKKIKNFFNLKKNSFPYLILIFLVFSQILFGAFVSGLDAGKIYQTWPYMGQNFFPNDYEIQKVFDLFNFDSHSLVQFYHRNMAYLITLYILILAFVIYKKKEKKLYKPINLLIIILFSQVLLGVLTLLSDLNVVIASSHQIISVILVLGTLNLYYSVIK
tara:strand:- start:261 stop:1286 length:1026 start_codon:yes stop_codon:yes gene_type:complete